MATTNVGTQLNVAQVNESDTRQQWQFLPQGTAGYYNLLNVCTQHIANLSGGNSNEGTAILSYTNDTRNASSTNRLWYLSAGDALPKSLTGIKNAEPDAYALAYNPSAQELHFGAETPEQLNFDVMVVSISGQRIGSFRASDRFSMLSQPSGVYIVSWKVGGLTRSVKFRK